MREGNMIAVSALTNSNTELQRQEAKDGRLKK